MVLDCFYIGHRPVSTTRAGSQSYLAWICWNIRSMRWVSAMFVLLSGCVHITTYEGRAFLIIFRVIIQYHSSN